MSNENMTHWTEATAAVNAAERILVVTHLAPDGDAIGTLLGLGNALAAMGKQVIMAVDGGVPDFLLFLPGADQVQSRLEKGEWDLMISVDASDEVRSGLAGLYGRQHAPTVINLDHHPTNTLFGDIHLIMPQAVAAAQVVLLWLEEMGYRYGREVALPLLTGLVTDTLGFRTSNVNSETLAIAQRLMQAGASLSEVTERTLDKKSFSMVSLWKYALNTVQLHDGGVITAEVRQEDARRVGLVDITDGGLVGFLVRVNEAMIAAVFKETPEGRVEISLRSKPGFDVSQVAFAVGGGGHKQAAGATIDGPLDVAKQRILPMLKAAVAQGKLIIA